MQLVRLMGQGAVVVDGVPAVTPKARVRAGAVVMITLPQPEDSHIAPEAIPLHIVHEDPDLIVVNKPAGMVVHPAPGTPRGTLVNALLAHCGTALSGIGGVKRPGIVHRIDKDTTGLLVVAKSDAAHQGLAAQFAAHSVRRVYTAICHGLPSAADPRLRGLPGVGFEAGEVLKITTLLARHRTDRQRQAVVPHGGRPAVTRVRVVSPLAGGAAAQVECRLETGRTHQIRVHMAYAGPCLGGRSDLWRAAQIAAGMGRRRPGAFPPSPACRFVGV